MKKRYLFPYFIFLLCSSSGFAQTMQAAVEHIENLEKTADAATIAFFDYASVRFLSRKEKEVTRKKNKLLEVLQNQEKRIGNEKGFNGQTRLKSGYSNFLGKMRQFPENLVSYTELTIDDYRTGVAQKRKKALLAQLEMLKVAAGDVNLEVFKYITMNKCKDFSKGSTMPEKWQKAYTIFAYEQKIQESVLTVGALDRYFYELVGCDSLDKAESVRLSILQLSAAVGATVKVRSPVVTDDILREAAVNSINLYRLDAFRNFKPMLVARRKEMAFQKKYPNGAAGIGKSELAISKYEKEKANLDSELSIMRSLVKEMKKERDKHESAFDEYLAQFLERHMLGE